jgi:hypothetical protein
VGDAAKLACAAVSSALLKSIRRIANNTSGRSRMRATKTWWFTIAVTGDSLVCGRIVRVC